MRKPRALTLGDRLAVVAPASPFDREDFGASDYVHAIDGLRPDLVMISLSGFGANGPLSKRPAFGVPLVFMSGLASLTRMLRAGATSSPRTVGA